MSNALTPTLIEDFFFEQDVEVLAPCYRHGLLRSLFVVGRSLMLADRAAPGIDAFDQPAATVALVFFANELFAAQQAPASVGIEKILHLNTHRLTIIRQQLGLCGTLKESARFVRHALALKGIRYFGRLTYPLLAWLLYRALCTLLVGKQGVRIVTTNMQHPLSIACARAAVDSGQTSVFFEHATTPRIVFRDRGYALYFVQFPHTRLMMIELGAAPDTVVVLRSDGALLLAESVTSLKTAGICINELDSIDTVADLTDVLLGAGIKVILRVHDADPRAMQIARWAAQKNVGFDSAKTSRIGTFFGRVDLIVAGNSNVLADALIAQKLVFYYWSGTPLMYDYYGLVAYFQLPHATNKVGFKTLLDGLQYG